MGLVLVGGCAAPTENKPTPRDEERIVSLAPSITETLFALGAGPEVVGVSRYCDYPKAVLSLPKVGDFLTPNIEAIAATRPTFVIGLISSSDQRQFRALRAMGYRTLLVTGDDSLTEIEDQIRQIGDAIGRHDEAQRLVGAIRMRIESIEERLRGVTARRVLMVVGHQPMVAVGQGTYLDDLLTLAHASNIADASGQTWPRLSIEYIIATRPEVIIDGQMGTDPTTPDAFWGEYATIPAVRNHNVHGYPEDPTLHPGPRVAQSLEILARLIHPEAFQREAYNAAGAAGIAARRYGTHDVASRIGAGPMPRAAQ